MVDQIRSSAISSFNRAVFLIVSVLTLYSSTFAQSTSADSIASEYNGIYEYFQPDTIELAVSPVDQELYAIIGEDKYLLRKHANDLFLNGSGDTVLFVRNALKQVSAYRVNGREFRLLRRSQRSQQFWFARTRIATEEIELSSVPTIKGDDLPPLDVSYSGLNKADLLRMIGKIADGTYHDIHSILLAKNGRIVAEEYFYDYDRERLHQLRSATKSFVSALVGIAVQKKLIRNIDDPVLSYFDDYEISNMHEWKKQVTIRHLLNNEAGWDCDISIDSSAGNEQVMGNSPDWVKFTLDLPMLEQPGKKGRYCSGNVIVLGRIVEKVSGKALADFAKENLFEPMGIKRFAWNFKPDPSSAETFCQLYLRPRDMLKFGLLYLNRGKWNGKQVLPEEWIRESMKKHSIIDDSDYGYLWWKPWLNVQGTRVDGVAAKGNGGQRIFIFPRHNLVAVITGGSYNRQSASDLLLINHVLPWAR